MKLEPEQIKLLFRKVLKGEATTEERKQLFNCLEQYDNNGDWLLPYEEWVDTEDAELPEGLRERILVGVLESSPVQREVQEGAGSDRIIKMRSWLSRVAVVFLLLLAGWGLFRQQNKPESKEWIVFTAARGQHNVTVLPDSSKVFLNAGSQIAFRAGFEGDERCVKLTGEAFFEVKHDPGKPFIVLSDVVSTTVLGTSFNVKAYPEDQNVDITVISGKVKVARLGKEEKQLAPVILTRGMHVGYVAGEDLFNVSNVDALAIAGWKDNRLVFEEATLEEICNTLGRYHNIRFSTATPAVWQRKYSLTFDQLTLDESLEQLTLLGELAFERKDGVIILRDKH